MWLLPTRNRNDSCQAVLNQMMSCGLSTPGIVFVNGGDRYSLQLPPKWIMIYSPENIGLCGSMRNVVADYPAEAWYGLVCDDEYVFTTDFDRKLVAAAGQYGVAHGNDRWQSERRIHTYTVTAGNLVRDVGWWAPLGLWHQFLDDFWETITGELGLRRFCPDVLTEHRHHERGQSADDATYRIGRSRFREDQDVFQKWRESEWLELKERIRQKVP